jgi:hypothetical protein
MKEDRNKLDLQHESLKKQPFGVPEGYFESFADRLQERIREEENTSVPVRQRRDLVRQRRISGSRFRVAMAAAVVGLALITYSVIKFTNTESGTNGYLPDMAVLEQLEVFDHDHYLYELIEEVEEEMNDEEAFATQAIEYLAMNDAEMVLLFE